MFSFCHRLWRDAPWFSRKRWRGLPLIVTRNAGGDDLIAEGETGFLVPIRSPGDCGKINWFAMNRMHQWHGDCSAETSK
jgi:hypothetical protein